MLSTHVATVLAAVGLATATIKLISVSHGDQNTMGEILRSAPLSELALGTVLFGARNFVWIAVVWAIPTFGEAVRERDDLRVPATVLIGSLLLVALVVPFRLLGMVALYLLYWSSTSAAWAWWEQRTGKRKRLGGLGPPSRRALTSVGLVGAFVGWALLAGSSEMWLPLEKLDQQRGGAEVGYVLGDEGDDLIVMREHDRGIVRVKAADVEKRFVCSRGNDPRTLLNRIAGHPKPRYPKC